MSKSASTTGENPCVLVVDDDAKQRTLLREFLEKRGFSVKEAPSAEDALVVLAEAPVQIIVSDVQMPGMSGLELLKKIREDDTNLPVLLITAYGDIRDAVVAMQDGAMNYLEKPIDLDEFLDALRYALGIPEEQSEEAEALPALPEGIIVRAPVMKDVIREIALIAPSEVRVLITGENGTGKEVIADLVHAWSKRAKEPILKINCAAIPENLLESELFGHERGSFTGATATREGLFAQADGGTVFLDEIGEMALALQVKLLRVTEQGTFTPIGGKLRSCDVRILAATNLNLEEAVAQGRFREDLFFRLNTFELYIPPLRERLEEIIPLAQAFASHFGGAHKRFSPAVTSLMTVYDWPGNVRELRNAMERAVLLGSGSDVIVPEHLPKRIRSLSAPSETQTSSGGGTLEEVERQTILQTLKKNGYNRSKTARELGMSRRNLTYKVRRLKEAGYEVDA